MLISATGVLRPKASAGGTFNSPRLRFLIVFSQLCEPANYAWHVNFSSGNAYYGDRSSDLRVCLVHGGQLFLGHAEIWVLRGF